MFLTYSFSNDIPINENNSYDNLTTDYYKVICFDSNDNKVFSIYLKDSLSNIFDEGFSIYDVNYRIIYKVGDKNEDNIVCSVFK